MDAESHIEASRLEYVVIADLRISEREVEHLERCSDCLELFAKVILEVARRKAREKSAGGQTP